MKLKNMIPLAVTAILLSGCVPVPSYSTDAYVGSLRQCLDIQGAYETNDFHRNTDVQRRDFLIYEVLPKSLSDRFMKKTIRHGGDFKYNESFGQGKKLDYMRTWMTFRFLDDQRLAINIFNEFGQEISFIYDMEKPDREGFLHREDERFICSASSWQRSHTKVTGGGEGGSSKERRFVKLTRLTDGILKKESERELWRGRVGLYAPDKSYPTITYHRKVDLTVDDIRAMNDKAKRAIAQYDQLATSPPPQ